MKSSKEDLLTMFDLLNIRRIKKSTDPGSMKKIAALSSFTLTFSFAFIHLVFSFIGLIKSLF